MSLDREKLIKILNLTQSDQDGECLNAIRMANRLLKKADISWEKLIQESGSRSSYFYDSDFVRREQSKRKGPTEDETREARRKADERARERERKKKSEPTDKGPNFMSIREVLDLLLYYYPTDDFIRSLSDQHKVRNMLTPRQYAAMMKIYNEHRSRRGEGFS